MRSSGRLNVLKKPLGSARWQFNPRYELFEHRKLLFGHWGSGIAFGEIRGLLDEYVRHCSSAIRTSDARQSFDLPPGCLEACESAPRAPTQRLYINEKARLLLLHAKSGHE
jgi:hypothetical protein